MPDNEQSKAISIRVKHAHRSRYKNQRRHDLRIGHQPSYVDGDRVDLNRVVVDLPPARSNYTAGKRTPQANKPQSCDAS